MKTINLNEDIKKQFEKDGLIYPRLKNNKKYGLPKSSLLDRTTEQESLNAVLEYLKNNGIIEVLK